MGLRIVIADDHAVVRDGLRMILEAQLDFLVVGEAGSGRELLSIVESLQPDMVLMDIAMPELNGIEATIRLRKIMPDVHVVMLSMYSTNEHLHRAMQAGADGYLLKESAGSEVVNAVRAVSGGRIYLSKKLAEQNDASSTHAQQRQSQSPLQRLSAREREILQLVAEGWSSAAIADRLSLSPKTIETYRCRLMQKLCISDLPGLIRFAIQHGLTPIG